MIRKQSPKFRRFPFGSYYKRSSLYVVSVILLFISIGFLTTVKPAYRFSSQMITNWTSNVDSATFLLLLGMENRSFKKALPNDKALPKLSTIFFQVVTNLKPNDPRSLLGRELPGLQTGGNEFIIAGEGIDYTYISFESSPPLEDILEDREAVYEESEDEKDQEDQLDSEIKHTTGDRKVVFIYNSHNRESFLPHLPDITDPNLAQHAQVNITKVSERLATSLEAQGIGTHVDETDIMSVLNDKGWIYGQSYQASRSVVEEAMATNKDIQYIFDLHRDALPRDKTTIDIDGEPYAQILMVIGAEHPNYENNLALATKIHYLLEEKYPGLSKGILKKEGPGNNGVYNQDITGNALLFELGGFDNKLEELYRTADLLAEIFSDFYWDAEKVHADG